MMIEILAKGTLLLLVAWRVTVMLRRAPAATRHLAWSTALAGMLALPALVPFVPALRVLPIAWRVAAPAHATDADLHARPSAADDTGSADAGSITDGGTTDPPSPAAGAPPRESAPAAAAA